MCQNWPCQSSTWSAEAGSDPERAQQGAVGAEDFPSVAADAEDSIHRRPSCTGKMLRMTRLASGFLGLPGLQSVPGFSARKLRHALVPSSHAAASMGSEASCRPATSATAPSGDEPSRR